MEKFIDGANKSIKEEGAIIQRQLEQLEAKKLHLRKQVALGGMPPDMREFLPEIEKDIATLKEKCAAPDINISNLCNNLNKAIDFTQNASEYWAFCSFTGKRVIQQLVFPIGLVIDTQNR